MHAETSAVLRQVSEACGRSWRLVGRLAGGWQSGAYLIEDDEGNGVLKWSQRTWWAPRVEAARGLVEHARSYGYPTPRWLAAGTTAEGFPYEVQEFVDGEALGGLDDERVEAIISVTQIQRRIRFTEAVDWTDYMCGLVFDDREGYQQALRARAGAVEAAVAAARELSAPHRNAQLQRAEMVHGDFSTENLLVRDGDIVAVIDIEALGVGCASFDLLTPSRQSYVWGPRGGPAMRLVEEALRVDGPGFVAIAAAAHVINILAFGADNWPDEDVQRAAISALAWIADVKSAL